MVHLGRALDLSMITLFCGLLIPQKCTTAPATWEDACRRVAPSPPYQPSRRRIPGACPGDEETRMLGLQCTYRFSRTFIRRGAFPYRCLRFNYSHCSRLRPSTRPVTSRRIVSVSPCTPVLRSSKSIGSFPLRPPISTRSILTERYSLTRPTLPSHEHTLDLTTRRELKVFLSTNCLQGRSRHGQLLGPGACGPRY
jgi:hypothetical protein